MSCRVTFSQQALRLSATVQATVRSLSLQPRWAVAPEGKLLVSNCCRAVIEAGQTLQSSLQAMPKRWQLLLCRQCC